MELTVLKLEVANLNNPDISESVEFLVDSGAIYSVIPEKILEKLGIKSITTQEFHLANGETITRKRGFALFKYKDRIGGADVIFGEENDYNLLGAFTLESLGLALDPLKKELKQIPMVLA